MQDSELAAEEARRIAQHGSVKGEIEGRVNSEIAARAEDLPTDRRIDETANKFHERAVDEVISSENEIGRARAAARISQIVDYIFYLVYLLLGFRLLLSLMAARSSNGFVEFIRNVTDPIYAPFKGIVASPSAEGGFTLALPIVVAIIAYIILHIAINGLLRLFASRKTEI